MAKQEEDYYEILGVEHTASGEELKKAFRKLAMMHHPDHNPADKQAEQRFKKVAEAYEVLSDADKRAAYDRFGKAGLQGAHVGDFAGFEDIFHTFGDVFGGDVFEDLFVGASRHRSRGANHRITMDLTLEEAAQGMERVVDITRNEPCDTCHGGGAAPGTRADTCSYCHGYGQIQHRQGFFTMRETCPNCRGSGRIIRHFCKECKGAGRMPKKVRMTIRIPAGIDDGQRLVLRGEGDPGENGSPRGDLYCDIHIKPHSIFERRGEDIVCEAPLTFAQAALGTEIDVPTLTGKSKLKVPAGTDSGKVFKLAGHGLPNVNGYGHGHEYVVVVVEVPKHLTADQEKLLREFAKTESATVSPRRQSFLDKIKKAFENE